MRGVRNSPYYHPCLRPPHVKEFRFRLPPNIIFCPQLREPLSAVLRIALHEFQATFRRRQWRCIDVNAQHIDKPQILAHALMHHLFAYAAPSRVIRSRTHRKILIAELTPHAHNLHPLGLVGFHKKCVFHGMLPARWILWHHPFSTLPRSIGDSVGCPLPLASLSTSLPHWWLTCAANRSIYSLTRVVLLLPPPVSSARKSERLGDQDAESCPRYSRRVPLDFARAHV